MKSMKYSIFVMALAIVSSTLYADLVLDGKKAKKEEVRHSMEGFRNTLLFYVFKDQPAILVLSIDNKDETFPVTGKVYLFDEKTTGENLQKWINNQHSDGLFPDVPKPTSTVELPKGTCKVTSYKETGTSKDPTAGKSTAGKSPIFRNFEVQVSIGKYAFEKKFNLSEFTDAATVHVRGK